ncbi:response regulator [Altererythrobacter aerius]|uniref:Response regulator n=1 Tax=Tsuneonella aeria TaxID=1837929 RepID=A0A6I4TCN9_9SPHN|nr:response regulator [Tsuneonella aeria]
MGPEGRVPSETVADRPNGPAAASVATAPHAAPAGAPAAVPPPAPHPATAAAPRAQRTCLLVDDSRMIRKVARRIVEGAGYAVVEAENGEEGLARCRSAMPDLVITDWNMPVMTGIEFVTALRAIPSARPPRVVFCTTNSGARDIHKGIEAGADEYVIKPFDDAALLSRLESIGAV